jgi:hypothetical protein
MINGLDLGAGLPGERFASQGDLSPIWWSEINRPVLSP